jgi:biopolymer transport protein ExbD
MASVPEMPSVEINMTPMIDIVFQLLIFFMLVSEVSQLDGAKMALPYASASSTDFKVDQQFKMVTVCIEKTGNIPGVGRLTVQGKEHNEKSLAQLIQSQAQLAGYEDTVKRISNLKVRIRADREARYKSIQRVFEACQANMVYKTEVMASPSPTRDDPTQLQEKKKKR